MNHFYADFCAKIIQKINMVGDETSSMSAILEDVCQFFGFACAYVYQADYSGIFHKKHYYQLCELEYLEDDMDLKDILGEVLLRELAQENVVMFSGDSKKTPLQQKLGDIFNANTLILNMIKDQNSGLIAFIGLADRRGANRQVQIDNNSSAILSLLANQINLEISQTRTTNAEKALSNVLDHVGIDIYVNDYYTHDILYVNKSMAKPYGGIDQMLGKKCWGVIFNDKTEECLFCPQPRLLDDSGNPSKMYSWDYQRPFDGSWFRVLSSAFPWVDGRMAHLVASVDITESKKNELLIQQMAEYDHLTGLANRRKMLDEVEAFLADSTLFGDSWYMLFCDLDGFKQINDTYGHRAGDQLLRDIGKRLQNNSLFNRNIYRHGGDEFVALLSGKWSKTYLVEVIQNLMAEFTGSCEYENHTISCGCSIGVAHFPSDGNTLDVLLDRADIAMYEAKNDGKGTVKFYSN